MSKPKVPRLSNQILDEASTWFVEFSAGDLDQTGREEFIRWLRTSPEHVRAYLQISAHWDESGVLEASAPRDVDELIAMARNDTNVVPLGSRQATRDTAPADADVEPSAVPSRGWPRRAIAAAAGALAIGLLAGTWYYTNRETYATGIGEQRTLTLDDGSVVELNARSRIRVVYDTHRRDIELLQGQALFRVAKDHARPFLVRAGETSVGALGTQFDVYRRDSGATTVTVVEGSVAVSTRATAGVALEPVEPSIPEREPRPVNGASVLVAGEQIKVLGSAATKVAHPNVLAATAWTQKQIVFQSTPLVEVVEEFNRYNRRQLVITDPGIRAIRISGVFSSTDMNSLLNGLRDLGAFAFTEKDDRIEIAHQ